MPLKSWGWLLMFINEMIKGFYIEDLNACKG